MSENHNENGRFQRPDERLLVALASGLSIRKAAKAARLSQQTVSRRLEDPCFRRRLSEARSRMLDEALGRLARAASAAGVTLHKLLKASSEMARLGAARAILELQGKLRETAEFEERLRLLEERLATHAASLDGDGNRRACR